MHSVEPLNGTTSTSIPPSLNQPILVATANGATAILRVFEHQATRTLVTALACDENPRPLISAANSTILFISITPDWFWAVTPFVRLRFWLRGLHETPPDPAWAVAPTRWRWPAPTNPRTAGICEAR